ncbi:MAG: hypothetical protein QXO86_00385 [Nitrososphaerota archaeon]
MLRAIIAALSLMLLLGVSFTGGIQLPVYDAQRAVIGEFLKAIFFHLTPVSSLIGGGVLVTGLGFTISSSYGLLPLLSLAFAGLLAGLMCRSTPQAILAGLTSSIILIVMAISLLLGFTPTLPNQEGDMRWQVDKIFSTLFIDSPLELPVIVAVPTLASIPTGMIMERLWSERSREERPLFSWRRSYVEEAS